VTVFELFAGARMDNPNQFVLVQQAAQKEWLLLSLMCIKGGVDPNSADYDQRTVMHVAACTKNLRVVQGLLQVGASVNKPDRCGSSMLTVHLEVTTNALSPAYWRLLHSGGDDVICPCVIACIDLETE
jgi:hypothetical protein